MAELDELREAEKEARQLQGELEEKRQEVLEAAITDKDLTDRERIVCFLKGIASEKPIRYNQVRAIMTCLVDREVLEEQITRLLENGELMEVDEHHIMAV